MTAKSSKQTKAGQARYELVVKNEGHTAYQDAEFWQGAEGTIEKEARRIHDAVCGSMLKGTWTVEIWRSIDGSEGNLIIEIDSTGELTWHDAPVTEQTLREGRVITFRSEKERMVAAALLTNAGMKGLTGQVFDHGTKLVFTDSQTAKQAEMIVGTHDLAMLTKQALR